MEWTAIQPSRAEWAYDQMAGVYDAFTSADDYGRWGDLLVATAAAHGVTGGRVYDIATGTGKVAAQFAARGWQVQGADISSGMLAIAASRPELAGVPLVQADMRSLQALAAPVDLITCIDDAINYLETDEDLAAAFTGMAGALRVGGLAVFDVNTLATYRSTFTSTRAGWAGEALTAWMGQCRPDHGSDELALAVIEIFTPTAADGLWTHMSVEHRQRHHSRRRLAQALSRGGLSLEEVRGLTRTGATEEGADEFRHHKHIYVARKPRRQSGIPERHRFSKTRKEV